MLIEDMSSDRKKENTSEEEIIRLDDDITIDDGLVDDLEDAETKSHIEDEPVISSKDSHKDKDGVVSKKDKTLEDAIDDIVAQEADTVLEAEDRARLRLSDDETPAPEVKQSFLKSLWANPRRRWSLLIIFTVLISGLAIIPDSRYFLLNVARVRASVELSVIDSSTLQPLKNVTVKVANSEAKTDSDGRVKLDNVLLGKTSLKVDKRAFAGYDKPITVGWGSNPLGEFSVEPVGGQYTFYVKDFLSGKPVVKAEASSGDASAFSDENGKIVLVLDTASMDDSAEFNVDISLDGYRKETLATSVGNREEQAINMVSSKPHVFVSKRSGKYDIYAIDVDGKNERRIVAGEGIEREDMALVPSQDGNKVAYVATRENVRNESGYLLSTIYVVDIDSKDAVRFDQSEQIKLIGWSGDRIVYVKMTAGVSGTDPGRHKIMSFNSGNYSDKNNELASSNSFNDVLMADGVVYYAPSNIFNEVENPATYSVKPDGSNRKTILDKESHSIVRASYGTLFLNSGSEWYEYTLGSPLAASAHPPASQNTKIFVDNTKDKFSLWVDERDGKGVLLSYDKTTEHEKILVEMGGLKQPISWLDSRNVIFRVSNGRETADYIISMDGGEAKKITDTTDTLGVSGWYYY